MLQIYLRDGSAKEPVLGRGRDESLPGGSEDLQLHRGRGSDHQDRGPGSQLGEATNKAEVSEEVEDSLDKQENADY